MLDDRRIEKHPAEVTLVTIGGESLSGHMFVHPYNPARVGRELPIDIVNSPDPYFPLQTENGVVLVAKDAIAQLEYQNEEADRNDGTLPMGVNVTLSITMSGGKACSGDLLVEGPVNTPRLLDFMNRTGAGQARFLALHNGDRVSLVNRTHIETIRTID